MAISNLETIIEAIENVLDRTNPDSRGKVLLPKDELQQLIGELKRSIPSEIRKFNDKTRELEQQKAKVLNDARTNAERIVKEANDMKDRLLSNNEQVKIAEERANEIIGEAKLQAQQIMLQCQNNANAIQEKALKEYDDSLTFMLSFIQKIGEEQTDILNNLIATLKNKMNEVVNMKNSLQESIYRKQQMNNNITYNQQYNPNQ